LILAGGLGPGNVERAIREAHPFALDVNSGVETSPRAKDPLALEAFCHNVRAADEEAT
jgi:phosphoribosylanthranilate isomerase